MRSYYLDNENPYAGKMAPDGNAVIAGTMDPWTLLSGLLCDSYLYRDWGGGSFLWFNLLYIPWS